MKSTNGIEELLGKVFDRSWEDEPLSRNDYERRRQDFIFHMTDWKNDLGELTELLKHPERASEKSASRIIMGFLYHAIPHLNAAGRLLLEEIPDAFAEKKSKSDAMLVSEGAPNYPREGDAKRS